MNIRHALVEGLNEQKMTPFPVTYCDYRLDAGASAVRQILSVPDIPTVVFCGSDLIARRAMSALEEAGVRVPEDVSIVGIDDIAHSVCIFGATASYHNPRAPRAVRDDSL